MSDKTSFEIISFDKHVKENHPRLFLQQRAGKSPELKTTLSVVGLIGAHDYVEIYGNKLTTEIKLVPVNKQTAFSRNITTDALSHGRIGGAWKLVEMGYKLGMYEMKDNLVFKYRGLGKKKMGKRLNAGGADK